MTTVYVNGNVYTVDPTAPWVEAFAVNEDGTFGTVGTTADLTKVAKEVGAPVVDLKGQFVMPGMHDAHCHLLVASQEKLFEAKLGLDSDPEQTVKKLRDYASSCQHLETVGNWLIGNFYHWRNFKDKKPDRKFLDDAFGDQPVVIREYTTHNIFANTAALKAAGYEENPEDPWDGYYVRREDGTITGELVEGAAKRMWASIPKGTPESHVEALEYGVKMANRFGFTAVQEASANAVYLEAAKKLDEAGKMTINLDAHVVFWGAAFSQEVPETLIHSINGAYRYQTKHFNPNFVKFWLDGVPWEPHLTHCPLADDGKPDYHKILVPPKIFADAIERFDKEGRTCKVHVCGQGSARFALDCFEEMRSRRSNGPKHELAHNMDVHPDDFGRYKKLGITAEMSPAIWHEPEYQPEHNPMSVYPFKGLREAGALLTIGSDWVFAPETPNIFPGLQALLQGRKGWELDKEDVIRIVTIDGATATNREKMEGSITAGKLANFIILDRDLVKAEDISTTVVLKTFFEGREVYDYANDELKHFQGRPG
ncbi:hydrolase [Cladophialophora carrionii]|uniref:Hydrolase n=1 Tax=Cladophialophora carrionii TaxID=86049 RepID=A0A1C1C9S3_9EURO|nr:hydrolase [Cladophialophora carrionii]